jgi:hypothetical protein
VRAPGRARGRGAAALALLLLLGAPAAASSQSYRVYGAERYFTLTWEPGSYRGRPTVAGYVGNEYGIAAANVRLLVESLDASGEVTGTTVGYVNGFVLPGTHVYYEVFVPARAPAYRVAVLSWDWRYAPSGAVLPRLSGAVLPRAEGRG